MNLRFLIIGGPLLVALVTSGCSEQEPGPGKAATATPSVAAGNPAQAASAGTTTAKAKAARWYEHDQVERGAAVYAQTCAACHGMGAEGAFAWRKRDANGKLPPPPLNGTGHAWHHPIQGLGSQIKFGAPGGQGSMPGFASALKDERILDVIAWFQSKWPDERYAAWLKIEMRARAPKQ